MWHDIQIILRMIVNCVCPLALIFIMSNFKCGRKKVRMLYAGLVLFGLVFNLLVFYFAGRQIMMQFFALSIAIPSLILLLIFTQDKFQQLFFNFFTAINALYFTSIIGRIIAGMDEIIWLDALIKGVLYCVILYLFARYFSGPYHFLVTNMKKGWSVISVIPFLFFVIVMFLGLYPRIRNDNFPAVLLMYAILCCVYVVIYQVFKGVYDLSMHKQAAELLEVQLAMQKTQLSMQEENMEKVRLLRHDMRHYTQTAGVLLKEGNIMGALEFLEKYDELFEKTKVQTYCKSAVLNTVLSYYIDAAKKDGIDVKTRLNIAESLPVEEGELAIVFANAIENAHQACMQLPQKDRQISITFLSSPQFVLEIANTCEGEILFDENHIPITKKQGHGYGTQSIAAFARKNHALLNYKVENGMFRMQVLLQKPEK